MMRNKITHNGIVESVEKCLVRVRIRQTSACASCKIFSHCNASESKVKMIDIPTTQASSFLKGENVVVSVSGYSARNALMLGFGLPFAVMVLAIFVCMWLTSDETLSALTGLAVLVPYYFLVWLFRDRIGSSVVFGVEKQEDK